MTSSTTEHGRTQPRLAERRDATAPVAARRGPPIARVVLGLLVLLMAIAQATDVAGFADVLRGYHVGPADAAWLLAITFVVAEASAGVLLLVAPARLRIWGAALALGVAVAWSILALQAFVRGLSVPNCGCFGVHLGQPLRWWIFVEDVEFIALGVLVLGSVARACRSQATALVETST